MLHVVATPIGNLQDLSARARQVLASADLVAAEDTRHTLQLLEAHGIRARLLSLHEHNEAQRVAEILQALGSGASVALVSDAGTPLVSDPGLRVVQAAIDGGFEVRTIPGPCAAIAALSVAGLETERFAFEGFLPAKSAARRERLEALRAEPRTLMLRGAASPRRESRGLEHSIGRRAPRRGGTRADEDIRDRVPRHPRAACRARARGRRHEAWRDRDPH
jgi:16S rRNA (cytidine1402-2'-O)-methyltransferase